ncbi:hypothetical protein [Nitratireductor sp. ZSWI3]|uniref:hypothetical protein n=1 Tax=Nitratireductor sp. ZSWI3 TaxID=2966359 RepID=UPI00214F6DD8|nr:hypothetical protein [Nitratireductor sp. ZSWI3]MCR4268754.1 hypothetical protein [Nitratireductor sp. ZSWI3]
MDRFTITVAPTTADDSLSIRDAMQQVLDTLAIFEAAERSFGSPREEFVWRLQRASTNSPFTVVAFAEAKNPTVDVSAHVERVKSTVSSGIQEIVERGTAPAWLTPPEAEIVSGVFRRHSNGIGLTEIDFEQGNVVVLDRQRSTAGLQTLAAINAAIDVVSGLSEREAYGEIEGVMVAAGRYRRRPAIQIQTELYGFTWCQLSEKLVKQFGNEHQMADVWEGRTIGVTGVLHYAGGAKLTYIDAHSMREVIEAERVDLDSVMDPNFTAGIDPHEYLRRLHDGDLG